MTEELIFAAAMNLDDRAARSAYLDRTCAADPALRRRIEVLLRAHEDSGSFLEPLVAGEDSPAAGHASRPADPEKAEGDSTFDDADETAHFAPDPRPAPAKDGENPKATALPRGIPVRYFGDYEIRGELGRGGMGIVYEACQLSLNRPVALKLVRAGLVAGDDELRRFRNEAESVALLDHPGIVPIFEVGEHQGQHYFSMKLVRGGSLVTRLAHYRDDPRAAARLVAEAAEAVAHAHARGILHRDLKPANILVDDDDHPHVTDFGLAKKVEGVADFTQSGAILGTPAYMAPEQATGRRAAVTTATDIYGLGAVLYALLTAQAPFGGDTVVEILDAVRDTLPVPPSRINRRIPRDLETVCLKCLEKYPRRRFPSAQALADDLHAWLDARPISSRRVGPVERAWLWCRRKPAIAALSGTVLLAAVAAPVTVIALQARANADLRTANNRVEQRYRLALDALKMFHTGVSEDFLLNQDQFKVLRDRLLTSAAEMYVRIGEVLASERDLSPGDMQAWEEMLGANFEAAELTAKVGRTEDALKMHREVLRMRQQLAARPETTSGVARSQTAIGLLHSRRGEVKPAIEAYREGEAILALLAKANPSNRPLRAELAESRLRLATQLEAREEYREAVSFARQARTDLESLAREPGATDADRARLARALNEMNEIVRMTKGEDASLDDLREALKLHKELVARSPDDPELRDRLASTREALGLGVTRTHWEENYRIEGVNELREALKIRARLADEFPGVTEYRARLADCHNMLGRLLSLLPDRQAEVEAELQREQEALRRLTNEHPAVPRFRAALASAHLGMSEVLKQYGKPALAESELRASIALLRSLPDNAAQLARALGELGGLLAEAGKLEEGEALCREALEVTKAYAASGQSPEGRFSSLYQGHWSLANMLLRLGKLAGAEVELREALALLKPEAAKNPTAMWPELARVQGALASLLKDTGELHRSLIEYREILDTYERTVAADPDPRARFGTSDQHHDVGEVLWRLGRRTEAEAECRTEMELARAMVSTMPEMPEARLGLASKHIAHHERFLKAGELDAAGAECRSALAIYQEMNDDPRFPADHPFRAGVMRGLAESHALLGLVACHASRHDEAEAEFRTAQSLYRPLVESSPQLPIASLDLAKCLLHDGERLRRQGRASEALERFDEAVAAFEAVVAMPGYSQAHLSWGLQSRSAARRDLGDLAGAASDARRAIAICNAITSRTGWDWYHTARAQATMAGLAGAVVSVHEADSAADTAIESLSRQVRLRQSSAYEIRTDPALDPLRDRADFRLLLMDLEFPLEPFTQD